MGGAPPPKGELRAEIEALAGRAQTSRDFVPWRFLDAGRRSKFVMPASKNLHTKNLHTTGLASASAARLAGAARYRSAKRGA